MKKLCIIFIASMPFMLYAQVPDSVSINQNDMMNRLGKVIENNDSASIIITPYNDRTEIKIGDSVIRFSHDFMATKFLAEGVDLANSGDIEGALGKFQQAWLFDMGRYDVYYNIGLCYYYLKDYSKAIDNFNKSIELKPDYCSAYNQRGIALCKTNETLSGIQDFFTALKIEPSNSLVWMNMGIAYLTIEQKKDACKCLRKAIKLGSDGAVSIYNSYCR